MNFTATKRFIQYHNKGLDLIINSVNGKVLHFDHLLGIKFWQPRIKRKLSNKINLLMMILKYCNLH